MPVSDPPCPSYNSLALRPLAWFIPFCSIRSSSSSYLLLCKQVDQTGVRLPYYTYFPGSKSHWKQRNLLLSRHAWECGVSGNAAAIRHKTGMLQVLPFHHAFRWIQSHLNYPPSPKYCSRKLCPGSNNSLQENKTKHYWIVICSGASQGEGYFPK